MITVVIADDEKLIRAGIAKIIKDAIEVPLEIYEAKNGKEAFELCMNEHPDVLITDIRMPIMDGVELMKNISQLENKPALIVVSGYDDFIYAKAAIQNGALAYILKPVDKRELISAVQKAIAQFRTDEQKRNEQTLKTIIDEGRVSSNSGLEKGKFPNGYYCISVFGQYCKNVIKDSFSALNYYSLESKKNYECLVIPTEGKEILENCQKFENYVIGVSSVSDNFSILRNLKKQSFIAALQYYFSGDKSVFYYDEEKNSVDFTKYDEMYEHTLTKLMIVKTEEIMKSVKAWFEFGESNNMEKAVNLDYLYSKICSNLFTRYPNYVHDDVYLQLKSIMIENIWQCKTLVEWERLVIDYIIYLSELLKKDTVDHPYIEEAIDYIKSNFSKNINMAMVANQVDVNYTWFSEKFKEHTGVNFNEYLKKLRIEEACRLLEKGCYKVYEVSQKSGFGDVKYFTKTFKESTGVSPGEWKKLHD